MELFAQSPPAQAPSRPVNAAGLEPAWIIAPALQEMGDRTARLLPLLDKVDVKSWIAKGASETYAEQWRSSKEQVRALADGARAVSRSPEKVSELLELLFRIEAVETMLASLQEGLRKYQDPQLAQQIAAAYAENGANRERFRRYIVNLAAEREQQFEVMDREAQRCRGTLPPTTSPKTSGRKR